MECNITQSNNVKAETIEQQLVDVLRAAIDQIMVDRAVRLTKETMSTEAGKNIRNMMEMNKIKGKM